MKVNRLKTMILSAAMLLGISALALPQAAVAEPTLKQTMDWLTDYVVRVTGCEDSPYIIKSSYDA